VHDYESRLNDRDTKLKLMIHAEENALLFARQSTEGFTLYTWPMMMCSSCMSKAIQSGIKRHVSMENNNPRWQDSFEIAVKIAKEGGVYLKLYGELECH
jgi:dCMP deaminase